MFDDESEEGLESAGIDEENSGGGGGGSSDPLEIDLDGENSSSGVVVGQSGGGGVGGGGGVSSGNVGTVGTGGGWNAEDMLATNEAKYGYKSTYNSALPEYTLAVERGEGVTDEEYRRRELEAERLAAEIESSSTYRKNIDKELSDNEEEEAAFSAVVRTGNSSSASAAASGSEINNNNQQAVNNNSHGYQVCHRFLDFKVI